MVFADALRRMMSRRWALEGLSCKEGAFTALVGKVTKCGTSALRRLKRQHGAGIEGARWVLRAGGDHKVKVLNCSREYRSPEVLG